MLMAAQRLEDVPALAAMAQPIDQPNINLRPHVLLAEPNLEFKARDALWDRMKIKAWVPQETYTATRTFRTMFGIQRRMVDSVRPIFRGYVLASLNMAWSFGLDRVPGLRRNPYFIHNGKPVTLSEADEALLRAAEYAIAHPDEPILPYKAGDQVRITDPGAFLDQVGRVLAIDHERRIELLLGGLGRIFVQSYQIEAA